MSEPQTIEVQGEIVGGQQQNPLAVSKVGMTAVGRALGMDELKANLDFIRDVMRNVMKEGQDYGKIPGTGEKPTLLQPGAQKLLMTFQLTEYVKKEILSEYPGMHRVYEFTIAVKALNGKEWDGVGTCSTFEKKYRYRQGGRKCPQCGKPTILSAKKGPPGFFCWIKKGGCGAKFDIDDPRIGNQSEGQVENPDIADQWNTVRKIAFKRALVAAAINATNTSELWTQDLDDKGQDPADDEGPPVDPGPRRGSQTPPTRPAAAPRPSAAPAPGQKLVPLADDNTRAKMLRQFEDLPLLGEFFAKIGWLLPNSETVADLPLRYVPITQRQGEALKSCFQNFRDGGDAVAPYKANPHRSPPPTPATPAGKPAVSSSSTSNEAAKRDKPAGKARDPEWWRDIICPIPPPGVPRSEYIKDPDTVGDLYEDRHNPDTGRRLFGFINHFEVKTTWTGDDGKERPNSQSEIAIDKQFREALDACFDYHEKHSKDTAAPRTEAGKETQAAAAPYEPAEPEENDVPF